MKKSLIIFCLVSFTMFSLKAQIPTKYDDSTLEKLGWKLSVQAWTFHFSTLSETLDKVNELGIKYIELYPGQTIGGGIEGTTNFDMNEKTLQQLKELLVLKKIKPVCYGVVKAKTEADWIRVFEFAAALGIETVVAEPEAKFIDLLETLCEKHNIRLGIHNHAKPSLFWSPEIVNALFAARSGKIGVSGDIGHWVRSGLNPIDCISQLEGRLISFHFKDINKYGVKEAHDVPWGTGYCNIAGVMNKLKTVGYKGVISIEYEYNWNNSVPEIKESIGYFYRVAYWLTKE